MFEDASRKRFDVLLFWALDRLSREGTFKTLQYLNRLDSYGIGYRSFIEPYFDSCGIFKEAVISIIATLAKQEAILKSERTKAGLARAKSRERSSGAVRRFISPRQTSVDCVRRDCRFEPLGVNLGFPRALFGESLRNKRLSKAPAKSL